MAISYDTLGSTVTIYPTGVVSASGLNNDVAIVGGYDSNNADASVTEGESTQVNGGTEAETMFGADSELTYQTKLAIGNGATSVYGVPLPETNTTESFGSSTATSSGTLSNAPVMDPRVHPDEDITAQDITEGTSVTVNIVDSDSVSQPSDANTMNLNPRTGDWAADETSEYEITYTYGDFTTAIEAAVGETVRAVGVCTEASGPKTTANNELGDAAANFRFGRAVTGSRVSIQSGDISGYTPDVEDWRAVEVAPSRGTSSEGSVRTVGAVLGLIAKQPIDVSGSITYDSVVGLESLNVNYTPTQAEDFDSVTALTDEFEVAEGVTTSTESSFRDIYKVEIIDFVVEQLYERVKDYRGGSNSQDARKVFKSRLRRSLASYSAPAATPPLLASGDGSKPYSISVTQGATDTEADVDIGIDVAPIAKEVTLGLSVGPIEFTGASV